MNVRLLDEISAAELVSTETLMQLTGLTLPVCEAFHTAIVNLIEDVGDFDGLIVTPNLLIVGRDDRVDAALGWLARQRRRRGKAVASDASRRFASDDDSFHLGWAAETNPSLTFASAAAVAAYLLDEVLDTAVRCRPADAERLTTAAVELLRQGLPGRGGSDATGLHRLADRPGGTAAIGIMEV